MLVRITNCCRMGCTHCFTNAEPNGEHMSIDTFGKTLDFIERCYSTPLLRAMKCVMISGGEPLEHPQFFEFVEMARQIGAVSVLSNGMFLADEKLRERVFNSGVLIQITNDPRFYPQQIQEYEHPAVTYEHNLRTIVSLGRATDIALQYPCRIGPLCFNLRSIIRNLGDFRESLNLLRASGKMCTPSINVDGSVVSGETPLCHTIGTVESSFEELATNVLNMKCNKCGLEDGLLQAQYQDAIGI